MENVISEKLLSLVLGKDVKAIDTEETDFRVKRNEIEILYHDSEDVAHEAPLNLDTLTRLCKEWCIKEGYFTNVTLGSQRCVIEVIPIHEVDMVFNEWDNSEQEAVIKATEWVAKEKGLI
jgi:hypothetical protein